MGVGDGDEVHLLSLLLGCFRVIKGRSECVFDNGYDANINKLNKYNPKTVACYEKCGND